MASLKKANERHYIKQQHSIRDAIHLLLSILSECGLHRVPSECFRRAKFNQEDAVKDFWKLTFHIMQAIRFLEGDTCVGTLNTIMFHSITEMNFPLAQAMLRQYLFDLGYERMNFFVDVDCIGSRELLLAFAWVLSRTRFFSKLAEHFLMVARNINIPLKPTAKHLLEQVIEENRRISSEVDDVMDKINSAQSDVNCHTETVHKLIWLRGCLNCKWKSLQRSCLAYQTLADKIHKFTSNNSLPRKKEGKRGHLSVHETFLLRFPNQMKVYLSKLTTCVKVLQKLVLWEDCESLFWQWMESVVDLIDEEQEKSKQEIGKPKAQLEDVKGLASMMGKLKDEFEGLIEKNRPHLDRLDCVWKHKSRILPHKDTNREEHCIREQLQFEYPLFLPSYNHTLHATSMLEQLYPIESTTYTHVGSVPCKRTFFTSVQLQQEAEARLVEGLHHHLEAITCELRVVKDVIHEKKSRIRDWLESLEQNLPDTLCKIEPNIILV